MPASQHDVSIGAFACSFGDVERKPEDIPGFDELWRAQSDSDFTSMGCGTFRTMSAPLEHHIVDSVTRTLAEREVDPTDVSHIVFATSDATLALLGRDVAVAVLSGAGLLNCVPAMVSLQQCCSSITALRYAWELFADAEVEHVVVVSLDMTPDDAARVRPFALFGDAVASCLLSRGGSGGLRLAATAVKVDAAGLKGEDSFVSRQQVAAASLAGVFRGSAARLDEIAAVFPTNLYAPVAVFNATVAGIPRSALHFSAALRDYGHCGNSDWMINLSDHARTVGVKPGEHYLAQASAPGFLACALLVGA